MGVLPTGSVGTISAAKRQQGAGSSWGENLNILFVDQGTNRTVEVYGTNNSGTVWMIVGDL